MHVEGGLTPERLKLMREVFDVPDLAVMDDSIVNGTHQVADGESRPLAHFTGARTDYSLHRLKHYTATNCEHFQNFVLFTNYQFYVDEFVRHAHALMMRDDTDYETFVEPGNAVLHRGGRSEGTPVGRLPQMPAYHLERPGHTGITMINIGVGPSNPNRSEERRPGKACARPGRPRGW